MNSFRFNRKLNGIRWFGERSAGKYGSAGPEKGQTGENLFQIAGISTRAALNIPLALGTQSLEGSFGGEAIESVCAVSVDGGIAFFVRTVTAEVRPIGVCRRRLGATCYSRSKLGNRALLLL